MHESILVFSENNDQDLNQKLEALEKERGELTAEVMTKDSLIGKLEKEASSLKAKIAQVETSHTNSIAEHERKFLQLSEEMAAKVAEVCVFTEKKIEFGLQATKYFIFIQSFIIFSVKETIHQCQQRKRIHGHEICIERKRNYNSKKAPRKS